MIYEGILFLKAPKETLDISTSSSHILFLTSETIWLSVMRTSEGLTAFTSSCRSSSYTSCHFRMGMDHCGQAS